MVCNISININSLQNWINAEHSYHKLNNENPRPRFSWKTKQEVQLEWTPSI